MKITKIQPSISVCIFVLSFFALCSCSAPPRKPDYNVSSKDIDGAKIDANSRLLDGAESAESTEPGDKSARRDAQLQQQADARKEGMLPQQTSAIMRHSKVTDNAQDIKKTSLKHYRHKVLKGISKSWTMRGAGKAPVIIVRLDGSGKVVLAKLRVSSGNDIIDQDALNVLQNYEYPEPPEVLRSEPISLKVDFEKIIVMQSKAQAKIEKGFRNSAHDD